MANRLPKDTKPAELDAIFRQANRGQGVPIPTAVGFCMYIRRACLEETGAFRAEVFGKGYGEENDFCMRATYKGWSHALAADVFVYHAGETSFGVESETRRRAAAETLRRLYPEYGRMIADFVRSDPAGPYRIAASGWRMRHSGKPVILAVSHQLGGGVEQYLTELREVLEGHASMLLLTPGNCGAIVLRNLHPDDDFSLTLEFDLDYPVLVQLLRYCGVSRLHVQHTAGHTLDLDRLRRDLNVPADFSVHDYTVICPQVTLTDPSGRYCGEPDAAGCNACIAVRPPTPQMDIAAWRERHAPLLVHADRVLAPSQDAANRIRRYVPQAEIIAAAHPVAPAMQPGSYRIASSEPLVITVLGAMSPHKGIQRFRDCSDAARRQQLPLQFGLAGYVDAAGGKPPQGHEPFDQTGPYNNDRLPELLKKLGTHVVWFPAQWPETFSYTLSACLELGLPVVAPDLGAFPERVAGRSWTWIVPWDWDTARVLEFFLSIRQKNFLTGSTPPVPPPHGPKAADDFYPLRYLSGSRSAV
jgi:glycosyltransferase involved in cell wall biosynthesis